MDPSLFLPSANKCVHTLLKLVRQASGDRYRAKHQQKLSAISSHNHTYMTCVLKLVFMCVALWTKCVLLSSSHHLSNRQHVTYESFQVAYIFYCVSVTIWIKTRSRSDTNGLMSEIRESHAACVSPHYLFTNIL
jgi:hypothetical protein